VILAPPWRFRPDLHRPWFWASWTRFVLPMFSLPWTWSPRPRVYPRQRHRPLDRPRPRASVWLDASFRTSPAWAGSDPMTWLP